ncbi:hypothetical protein V8F20_002393 [Naviculisporaceae sp. PSN 640]
MTPDIKREEKPSRPPPGLKMTGKDEVRSAPHQEGPVASEPSPAAASDTSDASAGAVLVMRNKTKTNGSRGNGGSGGENPEVKGEMEAKPEKPKASPFLSPSASLWAPAARDGEDSGYDADKEIEKSSATRKRRYRHRHRRLRRGVLLAAVAAEKKADLTSQLVALAASHVRAQTSDIRESETSADARRAANFESGYEADVDTATNSGADTASEVAETARDVESGYEGDIDTDTDIAIDFEARYDGSTDTGINSAGGDESGYEADVDTGTDTAPEPEFDYVEETNTGLGTVPGTESGYEGDVDSDFAH